MAKQSNNSTADSIATKNGLTKLQQDVRKAWQVGCPIVTIGTADPAKTIADIRVAVNSVPLVQWDAALGGTVVQGLAETLDKQAREWVSTNDGFASLNLTDALITADKLPKCFGMIVHNAHRMLDRVDVVQAVWNLRDKFKENNRLLILLGTHFTIPAELQHDVIELDEPLPNCDELASIAKRMTKDAEIAITPIEATDAGAAGRGLSAFAAEQFYALNMSKKGLSVKGVWDDKCKKINETPGLRVITSGNYSTVAGVNQIKKFLSGVLNGKDKPNAIVFVDEIEKQLGGSAGDSSGVAQDQLGTLLQYMQDKKAQGAILYGVPGTCKSAIAKASGGEANIPTIQFDLGAMKGSLVGQSEQQIRNALKVIDSISDSKTLWLATCNSMTNIPPELRRRYKLGTWFFDMPTQEERVAIWAMYCTKYELPAVDEVTLARELTGAEIESCCEIAWRLSTTPADALNYIVPITQSAAQQVLTLRESAHDKFLSASYPGPYKKDYKPSEEGDGKRSMKFE